MVGAALYALWRRRKHRHSSSGSTNGSSIDPVLYSSASSPHNSVAVPYSTSPSTNYSRYSAAQSQSPTSPTFSSSAPNSPAPSGGFGAGRGNVGTGSATVGMDSPDRFSYRGGAGYSENIDMRESGTGGSQRFAAETMEVK